jgi:phage shock protein E
MSILSILGIGTGKIKDAIRHGAVVIDVRTANEFDQGRVPDSINIPVDRMDINLENIRSFKRPVIICSNSDSENEQVISFLKANGVKDIYNGGTWTRILKLMKTS